MLELCFYYQFLTTLIALHSNWSEAFGASYSFSISSYAPALSLKAFAAKR
jgi:hypothetical protein